MNKIYLKLYKEFLFETCHFFVFSIQSQGEEKSKKTIRTCFTHPHSPSRDESLQTHTSLTRCTESILASLFSRISCETTQYSFSSTHISRNVETLGSSRSVNASRAVTCFQPTVEPILSLNCGRTETRGDRVNVGNYVGQDQTSKFSVIDQTTMNISPHNQIP